MFSYAEQIISYQIAPDLKSLLSFIYGLWQ
jgi:hypothetical protein